MIWDVYSRIRSRIQDPDFFHSGLGSLIHSQKTLDPGSGSATLIVRVIHSELRSRIEQLVTGIALCIYLVSLEKFAIKCHVIFFTWPNSNF